MKRLIREILAEEGFVRDGWLYYIEDTEDGRRQSKKKYVGGSFCEIDDAWECLPPPKGAGVGQTRCLAKWETTTTEKIEEERKRVFVAILIRLLADDISPRGKVHIYVEEKGDFTYVRGKCLISDWDAWYIKSKRNV